jgi:drug/metabolite transporter (DMT)-like permease
LTRSLSAGWPRSSPASRPTARSDTPLRSRAAFPLLAVILVVSWSSGFVGIRFATASATVAQVLFWRSIGSGIGLLPIALRIGPKITRAVVWEQTQYAALGMFLYLGGFAWAIGLGVPTGLVALTADMVPLAIAVLSAPLLGQRLSGRQWVGMLVGLGGVLVVSADVLALGTAPAWAYLLPAGAMVSFAISVLWQERRRHQSPTLVQRLCLQCLAASAMFAPVAVLTGGIVPTASTQFVLGIAWLVLIATYTAWLTYYYCLRRYKPAIVSSTIYLSPPVTMLWSWAMFGEPLTVTMALGMAVTLGGLSLVAAREAGETPAAPPIGDAPVAVAGRP